MQRFDLPTEHDAKQIGMPFEKAFNFAEHTLVSDPLSGGYDLRKQIVREMGWTLSKQTPGTPGFNESTLRENLHKALTTVSSTYSSGTQPVLIPVYVDPEIIDLTRRATPLRELIPRVANYGKTADFNQITAIATAIPLPEDAALADQDDTFVRQSVSIKYLYAKGRVTGQMFAASKQYLAAGGYVDALSLAVKNRTLALTRLEESMILLGDKDTDWVEPTNSTTITGANSYDGIWRWVYEYSSAANVTDLGGAALVIDNIRTAIRGPRTKGGEPNLIVCDFASYDDIKRLIQDELRYVSQTTIAWGITTVSFEGIPIIASRFLSTTAGTGSGTVYTAKSLFVLDTNVIEMRVLQDITYQELAVTNDSVPFMLKLYEVLVVKAPQFCWVVHDIGAA